MLTISITGVLLVWKREYLWITIADARAPLTLEQQALASTIDKIFARHPSGSVKLIQLNPDDLALHKVFLTNKQYAWHNQQGDLLEQWSANERLEDWLLDLHHRFLLGNTIGLNIAGIGGLLLIPLVLLGLIIWWPRRRTFKLGIFSNSLQRGILMRNHANLGVIFLAPILIVSITGVILVYPNQSRLLLLGGNPSTAPINIRLSNNLAAANWHSRLDDIAQTYPNARIRWISPATEKYPKNTIGLQQQKGWNRMGQTTISYDISDTKISVSDALQASKSERLLNFSYPLHTGKLPLWYRLSLSLFGLALGFVALLGLASYIQRRR